MKVLRLSSLASTIHFSDKLKSAVKSLDQFLCFNFLEQNLTNGATKRENSNVPLKMLETLQYK